MRIGGKVLALLRRAFAAGSIASFVGWVITGVNIFWTLAGLLLAALALVLVLSLARAIRTHD